MKKTIAPFFLFMLLASKPGISQNLLFDNYNTSNSPIPGQTFFDAGFSSDQSLWLSCEQGLIECRPPLQWTLHPLPSQSLPSGNQLTVDKKDHVWVSSYGGLCRWHPQRKWTFYSSHNAPLPGIVLDMATDDDNNKWVLVKDGGVARLDSNENWQYIPEAIQGISLQGARRVCCARRQVYVSTHDLGLFEYKNGWFRPLLYQGTLITDISDMAVDAQGDLWISQANARLLHFKNGTFSAYAMPRPADGSEPAEFMAISCKATASPELYIGTRSSKLYAFSAGVFTQVSSQLSWPNKMLCDHSGRLVLASPFSGLFYEIPGPTSVHEGQPETRETPASAGSLYPNPSNGFMHYRAMQEHAALSGIRVYNVCGKMLYSDKLSISPGADTDIDLSALAAGLYFVQVGPPELKQVHKIIIIK